MNEIGNEGCKYLSRTNWPLLEHILLSNTCIIELLIRLAVMAAST